MARDLRHILGSAYDRIDPRRRQELADARLISEDMRAMANLPDRPVYHEFNQQQYTPHFMTVSEASEVPSKLDKLGRSEISDFGRDK